jgi:hypothetical protein
MVATGEPSVGDAVSLEKAGKLEKVGSIKGLEHPFLVINLSVQVAEVTGCGFNGPFCFAAGIDPQNKVTVPRALRTECESPSGCIHWGQRPGVLLFRPITRSEPRARDLIGNVPRPQHIGPHAGVIAIPADGSTENGHFMAERVQTAQGQGFRSVGQGEVITPALPGYADVRRVMDVKHQPPVCPGMFVMRV